MPSRAYAEEETRTEFFNYAWHYIDYWAGEKGSNGHRWSANRSERNPLNKKEDSGR